MRFLESCRVRLEEIPEMDSCSADGRAALAFIRPRLFISSTVLLGVCDDMEQTLGSSHSKSPILSAATR